MALKVQAGGHAYTFFDGGASMPGRVFKKIDYAEIGNYEAITQADDPFQHCIPKFFGRADGNVEKTDAESMASASDSEMDRQKSFLVLENLLEKRVQPLVMDCKLGFRSFQEEECTNSKPRKDLYQRLAKIGPEYLTDTERHSGTLTKYKWMSTRDEMSSLRNLGFRIDGIAGPDGFLRSADYFADISEREKVLEELQGFLSYFPFQKQDAVRQASSSPSCSSKSRSEITREPRDSLETLEFLKLRLQIASDVSARLSEIYSLCKESTYVGSHEFVGASLLIVAECSPPRATVHIIDLAKTVKVPEGVTIDHMSKWEVGNHEDGFLHGLVECKSCWEDVIRSLQAEIAILGRCCGARLGGGRRHGSLKWLAGRLSSCTC
jgi:1D-myo-inositol-triphosphate 3-kinase